jgi:putative sterol carrier protein
MPVEVPTRNALDAVSYTDLYERWEKGNWQATAIDFSQDKVEWVEKFSELQRKAAMWNYSLFFFGEDSVADNLSPYIDAAPTEEQKYFLTTQQVDEARHAVFFARFFREVIGVGGDDYASALQATLPELTWGFRKVFSRLDQMADDLRKDRSLPQLAKAVTLYHVIVEATLAQPGQHFIDSYLNEMGLLPGFRSGMANVALDEQRHIGFGVKLLSDLVRESDECKAAIAEQIQEVIPWTIGVFVPPNFDRRYSECFGFTLEEIGAEGFNSIETKLRMIGFSRDEIAMTLGLDLDMDPHERVRRGFELVKGNILGEQSGPASTDPELMGYLFDIVASSVDHGAVPSQPFTIEWDFRDTEPWHIRIDNGSTQAMRGRAARADLRLECTWQDWTHVMTGKEDPRRLLLKRRLRPRGNPLTLARSLKMFPAR